jgi:hypothetical protein
MSNRRLIRVVCDRLRRRNRNHRLNNEKQAPGGCAVHPAQGGTDERSVVSGLNSPMSMAFLKRNRVLVLEKDIGRVQLVVDGLVTATVARSRREQ